MKTTRIKITPIKIKGQTYYRLAWPKLGGGRMRKAFKRKADAEKAEAIVRAEVASYGAASASIPDKLRVEAVECAVKLQPYGATLRDAVEHYLKHVQAQRGARPLAEAVDKFLAETKDDGLSKRYLDSLRGRLGAFVEQMAGRTTASVDTDTLADFLRGFIAVGTKRAYRANLSTFFSWCVTKRYCEINPTLGLKRIKSKDHKPDILTPAEIKALLDNCPDSIRAGVAIGAFAGLRRAEIERLDWRAIDLEERVITVDASIAKTSARRTVEITDNLADWLAPLARPSGPVWPEAEQSRSPWNIARLRSGWGPFYTNAAEVKAVQADLDADKLKPWPDNGLRHSAISYRLAATQDLAKTSLEAGNSPVMVKRHYLHLVKPSAAVSWFEVRPGLVEEGKITTLPRRAA